MIIFEYKQFFINLLLPECIGCGGEAGERDVYGINVCYSPSKPINNVRWGDRCTESKQCEVCTGNCSFDAECQGDLRCAKRDKGIDVPGCKFSKAWLRNDWEHNYCTSRNIHLIERLRIVSLS